MKKPITVLVTALGGGSHGMQILKALRLSEIPYRIVGTDMSAYSIGLTEVDHAYLLPPASSPTYIDSLLKACSKHQVQALFHGSESELKVMNAQRQRLLAAGLFVPINPANVIDQCMDKLRTAEFLESNGFNVPAYASISDHKQAGQFERFPAVLKPAVGGGGSANVLLAQDKDEMLALSALLLKSHSQIIAQQYIGTPESEYSVGVLTDMDGKLLNSIALRRNILSALSNRIKTANRTDDQALGPVLAVSNGVSQGEIGRFPAVTEECERIALALGATGAINIQCRLVNGKVFVFEINPRFSGTTSLRAMVGYNEPDILIRRHILGEDVPRHFSYRQGTILRSLRETLLQNADFPLAEKL